MGADCAVTQTLLWRGRELQLRSIEPADEIAHAAFFAHLELEDLCLRFFNSRREVPRDELLRLVHPDAAVEVAFIVLAAQPGGPPEEMATARAVAGADNFEAEFGITVRSDLKGQGLGRLLLTKLIDAVRRRGTQRIACDVLRENAPMRALASRLGFRIAPTTHFGGPMRYVLDLVPMAAS